MPPGELSHWTMLCTSSSVNSQSRNTVSKFNIKSTGNLKMRALLFGFYFVLLLGAVQSTRYKEGEFRPRLVSHVLDRTRFENASSVHVLYAMWVISGYSARMSKATT